MLPSDRWLTFSLVGVCERRFQLITNLNLPGALIGAPLLIPAASFLREHPAVLSMRVWHTLALPFFCLPVWWFVGRALDQLLAWKPLHWKVGATSSVLCCACIALLIGILSSPPTDKKDLVEFLPGAFLWTVLFGLPPTMWLLQKRRTPNAKPPA